jgi:hypothetical protein
MFPDAGKSKSDFFSITVIAFGAILIIGLLIPVSADTILKDSSYRDMARDIGTTIFTIALVTLAFDLIIKRILLQEVKEDVSSAVIEHMGFSSRSGVRSIHERFDQEVFLELLKTAKKEICILQTWIGNLDAIVVELRNAKERHCNLRILISDPNCVQASYRSVDFGKKIDYTKSNIVSNIEQLDSENIPYKTYKSTPIFAIYRVDGRSFVGFYWQKDPAIGGPQLELQEGGYFCNKIDEHFEKLWNEPPDKFAMIERPWP